MIDWEPPSDVPPRIVCAYIPHYRIGEAARYARVSPNTVAAWHKAGGRPTLSKKDDRVSLNYMQLIEVAVVAAFRKANVSMRRIRAAREYVSKEFKSEYPFAEYRFKMGGRGISMDYQKFEGKRGRGKVLRPDQDGQLAWEQILGRLEEFEYERKRIVTRWHVSGPKSPVVIDPRVAFGAPAVGGTPTWTLKGRWDAGETVEDIADDFGINVDQVVAGLGFEGIDRDALRWTN